MDASAASRTALATAWQRAAHQVLDGQARLLEDPFALRLLGPAAQAQIEAAAERFNTAQARTLRSHVVLRSRYAEDRLRLAHARGVRQYVLVGAGMDTFALRQPKDFGLDRVIEIDHPETQREKLGRMAAAGFAPPANVSYASIDFEAETLYDGLRRIGVAHDRPTFFSWLGVAMYLSGPAIEATLRSIASFSKTSELVLTYLQSPEGLTQASREAAGELASHVAEVGEPFVSYFSPAEIDTLLSGTGFREVRSLTPEEARQRYYLQGTHLPPPRRASIAFAIV